MQIIIIVSVFVIIIVLISLMSQNKEHFNAPKPPPTTRPQICLPPNVNVMNPKNGVRKCYKPCPSSGQQLQHQGMLLCADNSFKKIDPQKCSTIDCEQNHVEFRHETQCYQLKCPSGYRQTLRNPRSCVIEEPSYSYLVDAKEYAKEFKTNKDKYKCKEDEKLSINSQNNSVYCVKCPDAKSISWNFQTGKPTCSINPLSETIKPALCDGTPIQDVNKKLHLDEKTFERILCDNYDKDTKKCYNKSCNDYLINDKCYKQNSTV